MAKNTITLEWIKEFLKNCKDKEKDKNYKVWVRDGEEITNTALTQSTNKFINKEK